MVRLRRVSWGWSNALVLDVQALRYFEILVWAVAPNFLSDFEMELLRECFGKSVSERLYEHIVVVIIVIRELFADCILSKSC